MDLLSAPLRTNVRVNRSVRSPATGDTLVNPRDRSNRSRGLDRTRFLGREVEPRSLSEKVSGSCCDGEGAADGDGEVKG